MARAALLMLCAVVLVSSHPDAKPRPKVAHPQTTADFEPFVGNVSTALLLTGFERFDLMPKLMYAETFIRSGLVEASAWARYCYVQHEKTFNGFHEACTSTVGGKKDNYHVRCT